MDTIIDTVYIASDKMCIDPGMAMLAAMATALIVITAAIVGYVMCKEAKK